MSNETLLVSLQTLLDIYSKKLKATHHVIAVLKGKSSPVGKIQQSLGEYAAISFDDPALSLVQDSMANVQEASAPLVATLTRETKPLAKFTGALKDVISALKGDPIDVVKLSKPYDTLKTMATTGEINDAQFMELLPDLTAEFDAAQEALATVFGGSLHAAFAALGIEVVRSGYKFEAGRFEIMANYMTRAASISYGKEVVIRRVALSVEAILKGYQTAVKQITGRAENADQWMAQFYTAWNIARQKRDATGLRANIVDCYFEMVMQRQQKSFFSTPTKAAFLEYTRAQFAYDLFEIATHPQRVYKGLVAIPHPAVRSQTESAARNIWIVEGPAPHDGRYIGDIVFDKNE